MTPFLQAVRTAAKEIAAELEKGWRSSYAHKGAVGAGGDRSAGIDILAEEIFIRHLAEFGKIDSEESGVIGTGEATVILDPIDGSDNAISGLPYFGSSVALSESGETKEAVVVNLANGDCFYKGKEGLLQGSLRHERFEAVRKREGSTVGIFEKAYAHPDLALSLLRRKMKFRSPGAVALSLAYAHRVDFVIFAGSRRSYDFAAALWMCEDLEVIEEAELLIVAKERETARKLLKLAHGEEGTI